ncbi:MAG: cyclophilin-like fold protein [Archaeoglobaceae archaeon]|nr:cyclophilin-like fold protein [Archaeoglobaceae archaeon]MCX8151658.1 cyclophilin-like fold protein [Archaeoglobaceae archaeon]MDW8013064.1 cyclophilin-like fold protein [Archaeoglobaceae archaeon]
MKVKFTIGEVECIAELDEKLETVLEIKKALPIKSYANRWGDEVYFETSLDFEKEENSKDVVEIGDVAFWIPGKAICIFFGKTPISDEKIRPASAVNVIGRVVSGLENLKKVKDGDQVFLNLL